MTTKKEVIVLIALFAVLCLSTLVLAVNCPIPDTGQTQCYNDTQVITCPQPGEPFYGQDAQHPCNPQSYTSLDGFYVVQDNVTGLVWEGKTDDDLIHDHDNTYEWDEVPRFCERLNSYQTGGFNDWRCPDIKELSSIVNRGSYHPSINTTYFPNTVSISSSEYVCYWSATTHASSKSEARVVYFYGGEVSGHEKSHYQYVRAVRGGQCGSFDNFIDNGDGTVTSTDTGLMWELKTDDGGNRDKDNTYSWEEALFYCDTLTLASHDDWRLPNVNELHSIVDYSTYDPSINTTYFPNTVSSSYWSSTTYAKYPYSAWGVGFGGGGVGYDYKSDGHGPTYYVRAVRGGQCGSLTTTTTSTIPQPCVSESLYGEHSEQTELLRQFRDTVLSTTPEGQELIRLYYEWSPVIVEMIEEDEEFKQEVKEMIDGVLLSIRKK